MDIDPDASRDQVPFRSVARGRHDGNVREISTNLGGRAAGERRVRASKRRLGEVGGRRNFCIPKIHDTCIQH